MRYRVVFTLIASTFLIGCANPWEKGFDPNPELRGRSFPAAQQVDLRTVEFERLQNYEKAERKLRVESKVNPADFTTTQRTEAKNRLLEALQLQERGDDVQILGWSRFLDIDQHDLRGKSLLKFAEKIGADTVVATSAYAGQINRVVDYPLSSYSNYQTTVIGPRSRRASVYSSSGYSTVWVPTNVTENQYFHEAVFLRHRSP